VYILKLTALERLLKLCFFFLYSVHCLVETDEDNLPGIMTFSCAASDSIFKTVKDIPVFNGGFYFYFQVFKERERETKTVNSCYD
jgi:hypothetical protein